MTYDPNGPTAKAWAAREKLLALPRAHTAAERAALKRLEAILIREGVLTIGGAF
jgi:hypothetical protein